MNKGPGLSLPHNIIYNNFNNNENTGDCGIETNSVQDFYDLVLIIFSSRSSIIGIALGLVLVKYDLDRI